MKITGTAPKRLCRRGRPGGRCLLRQVALDPRQRERREQQHDARDHEGQPRVDVAQHDAEIGRHRTGQAIAQHHQRRQERNVRPARCTCRAAVSGGARSAEDVIDPDHDQRDEPDLRRRCRCQRRTAARQRPRRTVAVRAADDHAEPTDQRRDAVGGDAHRRIGDGEDRLIHHQDEDHGRSARSRPAAASFGR